MHHVGVRQVLDPHVKRLDAEATAGGLKIPQNMAWPGFDASHLRV